MCFLLLPKDLKQTIFLQRIVGRYIYSRKIGQSKINTRLCVRGFQLLEKNDPRTPGFFYLLIFHTLVHSNFKRVKWKFI